MRVNRKLDFSWDWIFCWDLSNVISRRNWLFRWDFVFSSGTFYPLANDDYHLGKKYWRKTFNHNFRPLNPAWFSRISTVFVVTIPCDITDKFYGGYLWFCGSLTRFLIKLFLKIVYLEKIWVTSKTNSWQQSM